MIKLSICIPTFNRKRLLKRLLDNCLNEIRGVEQYVEICVSDNGSVDGTAELLKNYAEKGVRFRTNKTNLGFDANVLATLQMSKGRYCWLIGDDDYFTPGAIDRILFIINSYSPDFIIAEFRSNFKPSNINWIDDSIITDKRKIRKVFLSKFNELCFMSSNIIRKSLIPERSVLINASGVMHTLIQYHALSKIQTLYVTKETCVFDTSEGSVPTKKTMLQIYLLKGRILDELFRKGLISWKETFSLLESEFSEYYLYRIFYEFAIKEDGCSPEELEKIKNEINNFIIGTRNDNYKMRLSNIIISDGLLLEMFKWAYVIIYVHLMNIFRVQKKHVAWQFWKQNRNNGGKTNSVMEVEK
jgi:glycosyltransferase involved in cell wall biosynthesis